jgi:hypothetical protein
VEGEALAGRRIARAATLILGKRVEDLVRGQADEVEAHEVVDLAGVQALTPRQ